MARAPDAGKGSQRRGVGRALGLAGVLALAGLLAGPFLGPPGGGAAAAADRGGQFEVIGSGSLSCQRWLDDRRLGNASSQQSEMWVAGFLTAYNFYVFKDYDITDRFDGEYILTWIDDYCRERAPNRLVVAAHELVQMLRRRR